MDVFKDILFDTIVITGLIAICLSVLWYIFEILNHAYKCHKERLILSNLKSKIIVSKSGEIYYSYTQDLDGQIKTLEKAIETLNKHKELQEKYSK